jgi:alpha-beta hydrolase superfamily lysophospholipase
MKNMLIFLFLILVPLGMPGQMQPDSAFHSTEMILKTATGDIYGTLTLADRAAKTPVVIIVAGSGPTDRNGNSPAGLQTNAYKLLAEGLASNGISSLRFDKRGIGQSKAALTSEANLTFETYIDDLVSWVRLLRSDRRFSHIILLGHSEGSLVAMIAAEKAEVAGYISLEGAGRPIDQVLRQQLQSRLTPPLLAESNKILDSLQAGKTVSVVNPLLSALFRPSVQPYLISWIRYNPAREIAKLKIPVLILQGTTDLQVGEKDAQLLEAAKPDARMVILDNMNHVLKEVGSNMEENLASYRNPDLPLKAGLVKAISDFIHTIR